MHLATLKRVQAQPEIVGAMEMGGWTVAMRQMRVVVAVAQLAMGMAKAKQAPLHQFFATSSAGWGPFLIAAGQPVKVAQKQTQQTASTHTHTPTIPCASAGGVSVARQCVMQATNSTPTQSAYLAIM